MRKNINPEHIKNADKNIDIGNGIIQHLTFNASKDFSDGDSKLFGITVKQQGRRLIIIMKIYEEGRREEIIHKSGIMAKMMIMLVGKNDIDKVHIVDSKDVLDQISKYKITGDEFVKDVEKKQDIAVEVIDLITGEIVPVEFTMGLVSIENR